MNIELGEVKMSNFLEVIGLNPDSDHVAPNVYSIAQFALLTTDIIFNWTLSVYIFL